MKTLFNITQAVDVIGDTPAVIQKYYEGVPIIISRTSDAKLKFITSEGVDVTSSLSSMQKELVGPGIPRKGYSLLGTLSGVSNLSNLRHKQDVPCSISIHDLISYNEKDFSSLTPVVRCEKLREIFGFTKSVLSHEGYGFNLAPFFSTSSKLALQICLERILKNNESAIVKTKDKTYVVRKYAEACFLIIDKQVTVADGSRSRTYLLTLGLQIKDYERDSFKDTRLIHYRELLFLKCGTALYQGPSLMIGDAVLAKFDGITVNPGHVEIHFPSINKGVNLKQDSVVGYTELMNVCVQSGLLIEKGIGNYISKGNDIYLRYPQDTVSPKFIIHQHFQRGMSHADFRIDVGEFSVGYTLLNMSRSLVDQTVTTVNQGKKLLSQEEGWVFNPLTGVFRETKDKGTGRFSSSVRASLKSTEPKEWLNVEGVVKDDEGTQVFIKATSGVLDYGFREGYYHEYFLYVKEWSDKGARFIFRQISAQEVKSHSFYFIPRLLESFTDNPNDYTVQGDMIIYDGGVVEVPRFLEIDRAKKYLCKAAQPPGEENLQSAPVVWVLVRPKTNEPYILSERAKAKNKRPPLGISALPIAIKRQIPKQYAYWDALEEAEQMNRLSDLQKALKSGDLVLNYENSIFQYKSDQAVVSKAQSEANCEYILREVRVPNTSAVFELYLSQGRSIKKFSLLTDPRVNTEFTGIYSEVDEGILKRLDDVSLGNVEGCECKILGRGQLVNKNLSDRDYQLIFINGPLEENVYQTSHQDMFYSFELS